MMWEQLTAWATGQLSTISDYNAEIFAPNAWTFGMAFAVVVVLLKFWRDTVDRRWLWVILVYDLLKVTALGLSVAFSFSIVLQVAAVIEELENANASRNAAEALVRHICSGDDIDGGLIVDLLRETGFEYDIFPEYLAAQILEANRSLFCSD